MSRRHDDVVFAQTGNAACAALAAVSTCSWDADEQSEVFSHVRGLMALKVASVIISLPLMISGIGLLDVMPREKYLAGTGARLATLIRIMIASN